MWSDFSSLFWTVLVGFPSLFGLFWRVPHHHSRYEFGVEWATLGFGFNYGPMPLAFVFYCRRLLGFVCLEPLKQSLKLWAWPSVVKKKQASTKPV